MTGSAPGATNNSQLLFLDGVVAQAFMSKNACYTRAHSSSPRAELPEYTGSSRVLQHKFSHQALMLQPLNAEGCVRFSVYLPLSAAIYIVVHLCFYSCFTRNSIANFILSEFFHH